MSAPTRARQRRALGLVTALCAAITGVAALWPGLHVAYRLPELHVALETAEAIIADAGHGFDPGSPRGGGFGLTSMRERAEAIGGRFRLTSAPGDGTEVEVLL